MLIVKNKRYVRKHAVGGAGIFDTVSSLFKRLSSRSIATNISKAAATGRDFVSSDIGKHAINAAKTVGKELATSAISTAKDIAIDKGKQLIAKARPKPQASSKALSNATSMQELKPETKSELTPESKEILANLVRRIAQPPAEPTAETATNRLLAGQGLKTHKANRSKAVKIQDMVRTLNGGGLRLA